MRWGGGKGGELWWPEGETVWRSAVCSHEPQHYIICRENKSSTKRGRRPSPSHTVDAIVKILYYCSRIPLKQSLLWKDKYAVKDSPAPSSAPWSHFLKFPHTVGGQCCSERSGKTTSLLEQHFFFFRFWLHISFFTNNHSFVGTGSQGSFKGYLKFIVLWFAFLLLE